MRNIHLYGELANRYGERHTFQFSNLGEGLRGINCEHEGFLDYLKMSNGSYIIHSGKTLENSNKLSQEELPMVTPHDLHIVPVIKGSKDQKDTATAYLVIGVMLAATGYGISAAAAIGSTAASAGTIVMSMGMGLAMSGLASLLAPSVTDDGGSKDEKKSFLFSGAKNVMTQGGPIPIVLGKTYCGSKVLSNSLSGYDQ